MRKLFFSLGGWLVALLLTACQSNAPRPGDPAPDFALPSVAGPTQSLSDYRGKLVLVHFWADWCKSCREEFPLVEDYYRQFRQENFEIVAINIGQSPQVSAEFQRDFDVTFAMLTDEQAATADQYGVDTFPTNYLVGPDGKVIRRIVGWLDAEQIGLLIRSNNLSYQ